MTVSGLSIDLSFKTLTLKTHLGTTLLLTILQQTRNWTPMRGRNHSKPTAREMVTF